jgi:hypothetical protein
MTSAGLSVLAAILLAGPASGGPAASGWVPFACAERLPDDEYGGRRPVRAGSFPESDAEAARAFESEFRRLLFGSWWRAALENLAATTAEAFGLEEQLPSPAWNDPDNVALLEAIRSREIDYRVERVVSWERRRCTGRADRQGAVYLEGSWDDWGLRALLWESGELRQWAIRSPWEAGGPRAGTLPSLDQAATTIAAEVGGPLEDVQYVLASGYPHCHGIPCVAARRGETLFLLEPGRRLFTFALQPRLEEEVAPPRLLRCLGAPCPGDPWVVAVGDRWLAGEVLSVPGE